MIISCPDCSGPFEIPDDQIAALVQIECPHCSFRMILDFAAANDPSLIEEGMQMASGYRSAADYRAAAVAEPALRPAPPPPLEEVTTRPEMLRHEAPRPELRPVPEPPARPPFEAIPTEAPRAPVRQQTLLGRPAPHDVRPQVRTPISPPMEAPAPVPTRGDTVVGPAPQPPTTYPDYDEDAPTRVHDVEAISAQAPTSSATVPAPSSRRPAAQWTPAATPTPSYQEAPPPEDIETRPEPELPSHATYRPAPARPFGADGERVPARAAAEAYADELDTSSELDDYPVRRGGVAGTVVVSLLLLAALGLVGASLALKNTADPRPLLEDLIRQTVKK